MYWSICRVTIIYFWGIHIYIYLYTYVIAQDNLYYPTIKITQAENYNLHSLRVLNWFWSMISFVPSLYMLNLAYLFNRICYIYFLPFRFVYHNISQPSDTTLPLSILPCLLDPTHWQTGIPRGYDKLYQTYLQISYDLCISLEFGNCTIKMKKISHPTREICQLPSDLNLPADLFRRPTPVKVPQRGVIERWGNLLLLLMTDEIR